MVSSANIVAMGFAVFATLILPIGGSVFLCRAKKLSWRPMLTGLTVFSVTQVFFRMPLLNLFSGTQWYAAMSDKLWLLGIVLSLSSALLENWGRWFGMRFFAKGMYGYRDGIAYGLGHGGVEAVVLMAANSINNLYLALAINNGRLDTMLADAPEQAELVRSVLIDTPAVQFAMGGAERLMVMIIQVALSLIVFYGLAKGKSRFVWLSVLMQFAFNYIIVIMQNQNMWMVEGYIALCAVAATVFIICVRKRFPKTLPAPDGEPVKDLGEK